MSAKDYPITFPYGATSWPYSKSNPHRGNDRATPTGTKIVIGDTTIGLTGNSGWSTGPHLHTQAGTDEWCQNTIKPNALEFKAGVVKHVGKASAWGNYVIIQVGSRYICYAHLNRSTVKVGQKVGGMFKGKTAKHWYEQFIDMRKKRDQNKKWLANAKKARDAFKKAAASTEKQLEKVREQVKNLSERPTKAELIKINEELKKAQKELAEQQVDEKQVVENWLKRLWNNLFRR